MFKFFKNMFSTNNNANQIKSFLANDALLLDVRSPQEFAQEGIDAAINIPLDQISNQLHKLEKDQNIIVFCRSGNRSSQAQQILQGNGFVNVINGGSWQNVKKVLDEL